MKRLKKIISVVLLATVMSMGSAVAFGGATESPGASLQGAVETPGATVTATGTAESPGYLDVAIIFMTTLVM